MKAELYETDLYEFSLKFARGMISIPAHLKKIAPWGNRQKAAWLKRIKSGEATDSRFVTYSLNDSDKVYLNGGLHRLLTILEYCYDPTTRGVANQDVLRMLLAVMIQVDHRNFRSHNEAEREVQSEDTGASDIF